MHYRVYFLIEGGKIRAAEGIGAEDDVEAIDIAEALQEACSEVFPVCELWCGPAFVSRFPLQRLKGGDTASSLSPEALSLSWVCQDTALALLERLQKSFALARESRKLLKTIDDLRASRTASAISYPASWLS